MKIALNIPEQLMTRLSNQMQRNGQTAAEVIRQAMIAHFDHQDSWYSQANPLIPAERGGNGQTKRLTLEPGQAGGFGFQTTCDGNETK